MHFALINSDNTVVKVITGDQKYQSYYAELHNLVCIPAIGSVGAGYLYEESNNRFIPPKPFSTWILDNESVSWRPPIEMPTTGDPNDSRWEWNDSEEKWE